MARRGMVRENQLLVVITKKIVLVIVINYCL